VTAKQLIDEMQKLIAHHPEAADSLVHFEGCYAGEDGDGNYPDYSPEEQTVSQVVLCTECVTLNGQ
jgi:hypothetical protein